MCPYPRAGYFNRRCCPARGVVVAARSGPAGQVSGGTVCFNAKQLDKGSLLPNAELAGTAQPWEWIGDQAVTTFSY